MNQTIPGGLQGPDGYPFDQIRLKGLRATGYHGVLEHERRDGQVFVADVVLHVDTRDAAVGDDLGATTSYAEVAEDVVAVLAGEPSELIETVAERIAATVLMHAGVEAIDVTLHKPEAPIAVPFDDAIVVIRRDRLRRPPVVAPLLVQTVEHAHAEPSIVHEPAHPVHETAERSPEQEHVALPPAFPPAASAVPTVTGEEPVAVPSFTEASGEHVIVVPAAATGVEPVVEPVVEPAVEPVVADLVVRPAEQAELVAEAPVGDALDVEPEGVVEVVIALGANLGDPQATLRRAVTDVDSITGLELTEVAPLARTAAVGGPEQPDFLNTVLLGRTRLAARDLMHQLQAVERAHGRERHEHWGPRTLDVDLIVYGAVVAHTDDLVVPHPRAHERAFVLEPWAQVAPDAVLPGLGGGSVGALAATAPDRTGIRWLALDWLSEPEPAPEPELEAREAQPEPEPEAQPEPAPVTEPHVAAGTAPAAEETGPTAVPSGSVPSGSVPSGAVPSPAVPSVAVPSVAVPSVAAPSVAVPAVDQPAVPATDPQTPEDPHARLAPSTYGVPAEVVQQDVVQHDAGQPRFDEPRFDQPTVQQPGHAQGKHTPRSSGQDSERMAFSRPPVHEVYEPQQQPQPWTPQSDASAAPQEQVYRPEEQFVPLPALAVQQPVAQQQSGTPAGFGPSVDQTFHAIVQAPPQTPALGQDQVASPPAAPWAPAVVAEAAPWAPAVAADAPPADAAPAFAPVRRSTREAWSPAAQPEGSQPPSPQPPSPWAPPAVAPASTGDDQSTPPPPRW